MLCNVKHHFPEATFLGPRRNMKGLSEIYPPLKVEPAPLIYRQQSCALIKYT